MPPKGDLAVRELEEELAALHVPYRVHRFLSSGSYGAVCSGEEMETRLPVAIKRVSSTVSDGRTVNILSDSFLAKRVLREVKLLSHFHHPNILGLCDLYLELHHPNRHRLYLVTELMRTDLAQVIGDPHINITEEHIQYFMYHILVGLHALHHAGVVHRDLHPGNILLAENNDVKICDFNLAREDTIDLEKTHYVTHRWYRAPELVMQFKGFTKLVDMWSLGCIMGELYNRKALFRGSTFYNQLNKIVEIVGTPNADDVHMFSSQSAREYLAASLSNIPAKPWASVVPSAPPLAVDLISKLLQFNPAKRLNTEQALRHKYFDVYFDESDLAADLPGPFHFDEALTDPAVMHRYFLEEVEKSKLKRASRLQQYYQENARRERMESDGSGGGLPPSPPIAVVSGRPPVAPGSVGSSAASPSLANHIPRTGSMVFD